MKGCYVVGIKTIIFDSEKEFREYVIQNSQNIKSIIVFEDTPDHVIFFYCFLKKGLIIATKEPSTKNFFAYKKSYQKLATKFNLTIIPVPEQPYVLRIGKPIFPI
jgi:hypothetical protein